MVTKNTWEIQIPLEKEVVSSLANLHLLNEELERREGKIDPLDLDWLKSVKVKRDAAEVLARKIGYEILYAISWKVSKFSGMKALLTTTIESIDE